MEPNLSGDPRSNHKCGFSGSVPRSGLIPRGPRFFTAAVVFPDGSG